MKLVSVNRTPHYEKKRIFRGRLSRGNLINLFVTNSQIHNYNTRSAANYRYHPCRTNIKQFTILYQGPKLWNTLPTFVSNTFQNRLAYFKITHFGKTLAFEWTFYQCKKIIMVNF